MSANTEQAMNQCYASRKSSRAKRDHVPIWSSLSLALRLSISRFKFSPMVAFVLGCYMVIASIAVITHVDNNAYFTRWLRPVGIHSSTSNCVASFGTFLGQEYRTNTTIDSKCLVESKFVKIQQHSVRLDESNTIISDWIWIDYYDRISVLVMIAGDDPHDNEKRNVRFIVLEQTKYALDGRTSMALVGGIVEPGEEPREAAQREVQEEIKLHCSHFVFLGRFRTDVNRGMGWTNGFLAQECVKLDTPDEKGHSLDMQENEQVGGADTERQGLKTITLPELRRSVMDGHFMEIQWTAIASLAVLHLDSDK